MKHPKITNFTNPMNDIIIKKSKEALINLIEEILASSKFLENYLDDWAVKLDHANYLIPAEKELVNKQYIVLNKEIKSIVTELTSFTKEVAEVTDETSFQKCIEQKREYYARLRVCLTQFASLMTCLNWQSPSIKSSLDTRIGIEKSKVKADWNDYKRDRSEDTFYCENLLNNNVIKTVNTGVEPVLNVFNSGMGAFTSILYFLVCEGIVKNKILASSQIYVESRMLLKEFFKNTLETFDSNNSIEIVNEILIKKPNAVFIEPVSNTKNLRLFDVLDVVKRISEQYSEEIYFIIDVTCSMGFENIFDNFKLPKNIKIILHGSILKAPQLGLERVNAGFVQTFGLGELSPKILDYRTLSGTNIQDFAANLLPYTTKEFLQKRMKIIENNAINLAKTLSQIDPNKELFYEIIYPGIDTHKDYELSKVIGFAGFFFNIKLIKELNHDKYFEMYTKEVIDIAKKYNCDVVHGASFGFNHTSIYYSVGWDEPENHYIRISTGTETPYEAECLKQVLVEAYTNLKQQLKLSGELK